MGKNIKEENNIERYNPSFEDGLTSELVNNRKANGLVNGAKKTKTKSIPQILLSNLFTFCNIMYMIIFALLMSAKAPITQYVFVIMLTINMAIGIYQEIRSKLTIDKLCLQAQSDSVVVRDGEKISIKPQDIVLDDIIYFTPGNAIPTDSILVSGEVEVNESQLTGESVPIRKNIGDTLYSGSFIVSGNCYAKVERIGKDNTIDKLASAAKQYNKPQSQIKKALDYILRFVCIIFVPTALILYGKAYFNYDPSITWSSTNFFVRIGDIVKSFFVHDFDAYQNAVVSMSSALLGMIPQGLILLTSVALAVGVVRLGKHNTLVQDMYCIEMLAHVDVLCLDKTGTITDGTMTVTRYIEMRRNEFNVSDVVASMNSALQESNSTSKALEAYFGFGKKYTPTEILAFSSENKYSAVTFEEAGTFVLGAPEFVLKSGFDNVAEQVNEYANQGLRVLALAYSQLPIKDGKVQKVPKLIALILIEDQIRKEAFDTIKFFKDNNVQVKVISGDNPVTVSEVARRVGIENAEDYISLEGLTDEEVALAANNYTVFGRVKPNQKRILVTALKQAKHTVAMTGDGVNDVLALKEADCSIAMASGCDAVRNVAQLVLLDSNFASMPRVVAEGRRVINNIQQSAALYLTKTLLTMIIAIFTMTGLIALSGKVGYPLTSIQMILIELFPIGLASFVLALQPNKSIVRGKFLSNVIKKSLPGAITVGVQVAIASLLAKPLGFTEAQYVTTIIVAISTTCLLVLYNASKPFNALKIPMFIIVTICVFGGILLSIFDVNILGISVQNKIFGFVPLYSSNGGIINANPLLLALCLAISAYFIMQFINLIINLISNKTKKEC